MIAKHIGLNWIPQAVAEKGWFNRQGMTPIESAFREDFENVIYQLSIQAVYSMGGQ